MEFVTTTDRVDIGRRAADIGIRSERPTEQWLAGRQSGKVAHGEAPKLAKKPALYFRSACASRRCFALSTNPGARAFRAPKETIMLYELRHRLARWLAYRQTIASLRQVPDSTLADAGISREEIRERARHASLLR